jgi:Phage tail tube protein
MALGSGMAAQFGFASETTYGTAVTVTKFVPLMDESLEADYERIESEGIVAGARVIKSDQWNVGFTRVEGDINMELYEQGIGTLFLHMFGSVTSSGTTAPFTHTFSPGDLTGKSLTAQFGRPQVGGVVTPFTYAGVKIASWEAKFVADENVTLGLSTIAKSETTGTALASVTYTTGAARPFVPARSALTTMSISGTTVCIRELTISGDNGLTSDRICIGSTTIDEPLESGLRVYEGTATMEFSNTAVYQQFALGGEYGINIGIVTGATSVVQFIMNARFDGGVPHVDGPDLLVVDRPFKCVSSSMTNDATAITAVLVNSQSAGQIT